MCFFNFRFAVLLIIFLFSWSIVNSQTIDDIDPQYNYDKFMIQFDRNYTGQEKAKHQKIFNQNYAIYLEQKKKGNNFIISNFFDWDPNQTSAFFNYRPENVDIPVSSRPLLSSSGLFASPTSFDWRALNRVTSIKNQGSCGSCWAFSSTAQYESALAIQTNGTKYDLAQQYAVECENYSSACNGGYPVKGLILYNSTGIPLQTAYPYRASSAYYKNQGSPICTGTGRIKLASSIGLINHYTSLSVEDVQQNLASYGPLSIAVYASGFSFQNAGPSTTISCPSNSRVDHAILLVGYNSTHWFVKNSWGTGWGDQGFGYISKTNDCGLRTWVDVMQVNYGFVPPSPTPTPDPNPNPSPNPNPNPNPNPSPTPTPVTDSVTLVVTMTDSFGDGWGGIVIGFRQNNTVVAQFGRNYTIGRSFGPYSFTINGKVETQIIVVQTALWTSQIGFTVKYQNGTIIYSRVSGSSFSSAIIFKTFCPLGGCPTNPTTNNYYITMEDRCNNGWDYSVLAIRQSGVIKVNFTMLANQTNSGSPIQVILDRGKVAEVIVLRLGTWTTQVAFQIRTSIGFLVVQRKPGSPFYANSILARWTPSALNESPVSIIQSGQDESIPKGQIIQSDFYRGLVIGIIITSLISGLLLIALIFTLVKLKKALHKNSIDNVDRIDKIVDDTKLQFSEIGTRSAIDQVHRR